MIEYIYILVAAPFIATIQFPKEIIQIFRDDPDVIRIGTRSLTLQMLLLPTLPLSVVTEMTFQCTGKKIGASILSSLRNGVFFIPSLMILSGFRGLSGVQEAQPVAYGLTFFVTIFFFAGYMRKLKIKTSHMPKH